MNKCPACGLDFGSVSAFDAHRVGKHEYTHGEGLRMEPAREDGRRCLVVEEIAKSSLFARNAYGRWSLRESLAAARTMRIRSAQRARRATRRKRRAAAA